MDSVQYPSQASAAQKFIKQSRRHRVLVWIFGILLLVLTTIGVVWFFSRDPQYQAIDPSKYQVVYLANGQAYFGKLQNTQGEYLVMKTPYVAQDVKPSDTTSSGGQPQTTLLKVSAQVYGPDDSIAIRASQVAFWQNLRTDSKLVQALQAK